MRVEEMAFENEFDIVLFNASLHHVDNPLKALCRARKALKSRGVLIFNEPVYDNLFRKIGFLLCRKKYRLLGEKPYRISDFWKWLLHARFKPIIFKNSFLPTSKNSFFLS